MQPLVYPSTAGEKQELNIDENTQPGCPNLESNWPLENGLPQGLPWQSCVALLIDGVRVDNLQPKLYQWSQSPVCEPLYLRTRFAELQDISPCLVQIDSPHNPILAQFMSAARQEWGHLVFSEQPWHQLVAHWRWLICVTHPSGQNVMPRVADPAVMHPLLAHTHSINDPTLFGPCTHIVTGDAVLGRWHVNLRPGHARETDHTQQYQISDDQLSLFVGVNFRAMVMRLDRHLQQHFPEFQVHLDQAQRWNYLNELAMSAYHRGLCSEYEITLFANIHGFLGLHALHEHPDLDAQLKTPSAQTPTQRLEQVASIAERRAEHSPRSPQ